MKDLALRAGRLLGVVVAEIRRLPGGDLSEVARIVTADGRRAIVKPGPSARSEAEMLRAIAASGAPAPAVLAVSDDLLIMADLGADEGPARSWGDLGRVLHRLHDVLADDYGWLNDHAFGPVAVPNRPTGDWPSFWAERRLMPLVPDMPADLAGRIEQLAARLADRLPARPPPSLLHGDLWTGNIVARGGKVTGLIDPACYHGHAEVDLAMLTLFGRLGPAFWESYGSAEPGIVARRPVYQLWPAMVHLRLFGETYRPLVERCLDAAGA